MKIKLEIDIDTAEVENIQLGPPEEFVERLWNLSEILCDRITQFVPSKTAIDIRTWVNHMQIESASFSRKKR